MIKQDLTGKTFHWLTVIGYGGKEGEKNMWRCKCKCGNEVLRSTSHLNENVKHSCGCRGWCRHHLNGTHFQKKYYDAKNRCNNPKESSYKYYGGKGVKFEWNSFEEFRDDMYESYLEHVKQYGEKNTTIDRIDSNGNYCKDNCKRSTIKEQVLNRSNMYEYKGKKISLADLAKELGTTHRCVSKRAEQGMSIDDIVEYYKSKTKYI